MSKPEPVTVFLSYAHEDASLRSELETHLSLLQRQGLVSTWQDRQITAGADWAQEIDEHLNRASIILLLMSADFLASDYCYGVEMQCALDRDKAGQARVIPLMVRPCDKKGAPFAHLQALPTDARAITTWNNRDEAWTDVAAGIRRVIEELPALSVKTPPAGLPPVWNIPYPQNLLFTGREELLTQLATTLHAGQPTALSQPQAISGLGGIGKTQLALEYAYRHRQDYQAVLWALADTQENLISSYLTVATLLNLPEKSEQESARVIAAVKNWLQRNTGWLLILDNANDLALARDFLPPSFGGHVLLTTRAQATGRFAHRLEIDVLPTEQGALFLLRRAGLLPADAILEQAKSDEGVKAKEICEALGGLPLALDQAGAYIEETECGLESYLRLYKNHSYELLNLRGQFPGCHPESVARTWSLSFQKVEQKDNAAAELLRLCAFLASSTISEEIISKGASKLGEVLAPIVADPRKLNESIGVLLKYSLVKRDANTKTLSIHRLVQQVLKDGMDEELQRQWAERTVHAVYAALPSTDHENWPLWERIVQHVENCVEYINKWDLEFIEAIALLHQAGRYLYDRAQYEEARKLLKSGLELRGHNIDPKNYPDVSDFRCDLANVSSELGEYTEAKELYKQNLDLREQTLDDFDLKDASLLNNLAIIYKKVRGEYECDEAKGAYLECLHIFERKLPIDDLDFTHLLSNLQFPYDQAHQLLQALESMSTEDSGKYKRVFLLFAQALNNLAVLYAEQYEKYETSDTPELLLKLSLSLQEKFLREDHPDIAMCLINLANVYNEQAKYKKKVAKQLRNPNNVVQKGAEVSEDIVYRLNSLKCLAFEQDKCETLEELYQNYLHTKAEKLYRRGLKLLSISGLLSSEVLLEIPDKLNSSELLDILDECEGLERHEVAYALNGLATIYFKRGKYKEAKKLYERSQNIWERYLRTSEHPQVAYALLNQAVLAIKQGRDENTEGWDKKAAELFERSLNIWKEKLGSKDPKRIHIHTKICAKNYAVLLHILKRDDKAQKLAREYNFTNESLDEDELMVISTHRSFRL